MEIYLETGHSSKRKKTISCFGGQHRGTMVSDAGLTPSGFSPGPGTFLCGDFMFFFFFCETLASFHSLIKCLSMWAYRELAIWQGALSLCPILRELGSRKHL